MHSRNTNEVNSVLVTGSSGFIGSFLTRALSKKNISWRTLNFTDFCKKQNTNPRELNGAEIDFSGVDCVIHLAAVVHANNRPSKKMSEKYWSVNCNATSRLARLAAEASVKRFIFISSVKVNGEQTLCGEKLNENCLPDPKGIYAITKWHAEQSLMKIAQETGMEVVIIRPPLVYGASAKANFSLLEKAVGMNLPLPFAGLNNKRSMVSLHNLVDFVILCITHKGATNQTFLIADKGESISVRELVNVVAQSLGLRAKLFRLPNSVLRAIFFVMGRSRQFNSLSQSLEVDATKAYELTGWKAKFTTHESINLLNKR
jgi:UDP-glucose 4-epimerase